MVGIILASHGDFANGIKESAQMIFGQQENLESVVLLPSMGPDDLRSQMEESIKKIGTEEILFLIDLWGGTPFNQASNLFEGHEDKWAIVTGLNLPMLIEALSERMLNESSHSIAEAIVPSAKEGIKIKPEDLNKKDEIVEEKTEIIKEAPVSAIPPGTIIGDGKIDIVLARIDTRLLHGQVATSRTRSTHPNRIIVVSDKVSEDALRKSMVIEAAPPEVTAHVVPVWKMKEIMDDPRFGNTRAMLLFEKPQDVLELLELGGELKKVNIGSMSYSEGKVNLTDAVAMDRDDVITIEKIEDFGVTFDVKKVPGDRGENLSNMLKKAKAELKMN